MKAILATCAVSILASLTHAPASDEIAFGVSKGTKLAKHFEMSVDFQLKAASLKLGGHDLPKELMDQIEMSFSLGETREIEDEYVEIDGARAKEFARTFQKATQHSSRYMLMMDGNPQDEKEDVDSAIVDHTVVFTWNAKEEKYEPAFRGQKGQAEWLGELKADTDFLRILPEGKVAVGDSWKIEPKDFNQLVMPGGDLPFDKKDKDDDLDLDENLSGEAEATYKGTREVDGVKVGIIALTAKLSTHQVSEEADGPPMKMEISFELEGELLWDLEKKHMHSSDLHGPVELTMTGSQEIEANGQKMEMKMRFELSGEMKAKGSVER